MKIIFLDFDGVLNSHAWYREVNNAGRHVSMMPIDQIDPKAITLLNEAIEATGAKIVVSSTWRLNRTIEELQAILDQFGCIGKIIGKTPRMYRDSEGNRLYRGDEIQQWLNDEEDYGTFIVDNFVIIDDDSDMAHLKHKLIQTGFDKGLQPEHVEAVIRALT